MNRSWSSFGIEPHSIVMAVVFIGALITGYVMLPGVNERIAMLERDGKNTQALDILERRFADGDRRPRTLYQLVGLYEQFGNLPRLKETLEALAEARPRDAQVRRRLVQFYATTQDNAGYLTALESEVELRYAEQACRELIGLHRMRGAYAKEQAAIVQCRQKGYRRAEDIVRLAELLATDGDYAQASQLLRNVDDLKRLKSDRERLQLFSMLVDAEQPREALRRGVRWAKASRDQEFSLTLIDTLVKRGQHDAAIELAKQTSIQGDAISLTVAEIMLDRGETLAARAFLKGWAQSASGQSLEAATRFIESSLDAEDAGSAFEFASKLGLARVPQAQLVALAEALNVVGRRQEFVLVRTALTRETLDANPLLGAAEELERGEQAASRELLAKVEPDKLDVWRLTLWARLMRETGRGAEAETTLQTLGVDQSGSVVTPVRTAVPVRRSGQAVPVAARAATAEDVPTRILRRKKRPKRLQVRTASRPARAAQAQVPNDKKSKSGGLTFPWPDPK